VNVVVVVQRPEPAVVGLMVVHVVVLHDHVTETEALEQVLEALERDPAALSAAVLIEQSTQRLPRRRVLPQNAGHARRLPTRPPASSSPASAAALET